MITELKVVQISLLFLLAIDCSSGLSMQELYNVNAPGLDSLQRGDEESRLINLQTPIHFYTEKYNSVYINTNGLLSFVNEFPEFLNIPFPIEYPSISPFYSNIDTTRADASSVISFYETTDGATLSRASSVVHNAFSKARDFSAKSVFVATWSRVPKWMGEETQERNRNEANTFQVAVISSDEESYVEFLYPQNGIQWIQAENGQSGLPDIRARAGFVASDGRFTLLKGSGSDRVRHLSETSNYGHNGRWLYRVGKLGEDESVEEPDVSRHVEEDTHVATSCADGGRLQCHSSAICEDSHAPKGFCCKCRDDFYGNGYSCIKNSAPIRVIGSISGHLGSSNSISGSLQAYVVMQDGRTYAAISSLGKDLGTKVQLLQVIGGVIGWLFAKPFGDSLNGYQITGGKFNHTASIRFTSGENLHITQRYTGLNLWDQLSSEIEISGDVPEVHEGIGISMDDFFDEYKSSGPNRIQAAATRKVELSSGDPDIEYTIYQDISYERCDELPNIEARLKTSRIQLGYYSQEDAVRLSSISKIGVGDRTNPCIEGTANCGDNTICVPNNEDDSYECQCKNGFTFANPERDAPDACVDIDECSGSHICSQNAECINTNGGYTCVCSPGFEGNGYECRMAEEVHAVQTTPRHPYPSPSCRGCSENARCSEGVCVCNSGFIGNGFDCRMICAMNEMFDGVSCVRIAEIEEDEVTPQCTQTTCFCPRGYEMVEYAFKTICREKEMVEDTEQQQQQPISCDVVNNCHRFANCEFDDNAQQYHCVCGPGYDGNGVDCIEIEANCAHEDICDVHADCVYNSTLRRSNCICQDGYEGNGRTCRLAAECRTTQDCGYHSICIEGICECDTGYERDSSDLCVPAGSCNGAYCAENAYCRYDERLRVNYCHCPQESGYIGDGVVECKSVPPACNVRNNCGLYASCVPNYRTSSYQCLCNDGYNGDGFVCVPENNCNNIPDLCDANAHCAQNFGKYQCICNQGYVGNGSTCNLPPKLESEFLIVSQGVAAVKVPLSGYKRGVPIATATMVIAIDKDCIEGRVYWSDISAKAIYSSKYDGTDKKTFLNEGIMSPEGIAIDWIGRKIYWADSLKDTIEVASLDNATMHSVLINQGLVNPRGLVVDPLQGKLFWSDWNRKSPKIESSNLDGTDRKIILSAPDVKLPNSLAISLSTGELCYADAGNQKIECIDVYTHQQRLVADKLSYPFSIAITDSHYYWSDWNTKKIESVDTNGVRESIQVSLFTSKMYGMTSVTDHCPFDFDICSTNNGDCPADHICLANRLMPSGKTCKCVTHGACNIHDD